MLPNNSLAVGNDIEQSDNIIEHFTWQVIEPDTQVEKGVGYYDFILGKNQEKDIILRLINSAEKKITVKLEINPAKTNNSGEVVYIHSELPTDSSLKYSLPDLVSAPKEVIVEPKKSKDVKIKVKSPQKEYSGLITGGIQMTPYFSEGNDVKKDKSEVVANMFTFVTSLTIRSSNVDLPKPHLKLNNVKQKLINGNAYLNLNVSNDVANYINDMTLDVKVKEENKKNHIMEFNKMNINIAPNSQLNLDIPIDNKNINAGTYTIEISASSKNGNWEWVDRLIINEAKNEVTTIRDQSRKLFTVYLVYFMLCLVIVISFVLLIRKKRKGK